MYQALGELGADLPEAVELLTGAARPILDRWFESDVLKATLATDAIIGALPSISSPGSAYVLLHHVMGEAGGARGVWGYVQGGMGGLADGAGSGLPRPGRRNSPRGAGAHDSHRSRPGASACGSKTARSSTRQVVASSVDAHLTFEKFLDARANCRRNFREAVRRIDYCVGLGEDQPRAGRAAAIHLPCRRDGVGPHHHGTMHIGPSLDYLERAYDDAKYGRPSDGRSSK